MYEIASTHNVHCMIFCSKK